MGPKGPRADPKNPGQYLLMTPETHPDWFHTRASQAAAQRNADETFARLRADLARERERGVPEPAEYDEDEEEDLPIPEVASDDSKDSDFEPEPKPKRQKLSSASKPKRKRQAAEDPQESDNDQVPERPKRSSAPKSKSEGPVVDDPEDSDSDPVRDRPKRRVAPKSKGKGRAIDSPEGSEYGPGPSKTRQRSSSSKVKSKRRAVDSSDEEPEEEDQAAVEEAEEGEIDEETLIVDERAEGNESDVPEDGDGGDEEDEEEVDAPADALGVDDAGWKYGNPKSTPLTYFVHADAAGNVKAKTIKFDVDFTSRESVNKANKTRRLELIRAKKRYGFTELKRPSTRGREYSDENDDWISIIHEDYAIENNGTRIPPSELAQRYNEWFPAENRAESSISSHIQRIEHLKDMRNSYPLARG